MKSSSLVRRKTIRLSTSSLALACCLLAPALSSSQTYTWTGDAEYFPFFSDYWSTIYNWVSDSSPVSGFTTKLVFNGGVTTNDDFVSFNLASELFNSGTSTQSGFLLNFASEGFISAVSGAAAFINNNITVNSSFSLKTDLSSSIDLGGTISGAGAVTVSGSGLVVLGEANSYNGGTVVEGGTLNLGADNGLGDGDVTIGAGSLDLKGHTAAVTSLYFGDGSTVAIGSVTDSVGGGAIDLSGDLIYDGIPGGQSNPALLGANVVLIPGNHIIDAENSSSNTLGADLKIEGRISGAGSVTIQDSTHTNYFVGLLAPNTYTGSTTITSTGAAFGDVNNALPTGTALILNGDYYLGPEFSQSGITPGTFNQTVASLSGSGYLELYGGTFTVGDSTSTTFSGSIVGSGTLDKVGSGTLTLLGPDNYGTTNVNAGTLVGTTTSLNGPIFDNATLDFDQSSTGAFSGEIAGAGKLNINVTGSLDMTPAGSLASFTGTLEIESGTLVTTASELKVNSIIDSSSTLNIDQSFTGTLSATLSGTGEFLKTGVGTVDLSTQTFGGTTVVTAGALALNGASLESDGGIQIGAQGTVRLESYDSGLAGGQLTNAGHLTGTGTINNSLENQATGKIQLSGSDYMEFAGANNNNDGLIQIGGGALQFDNALTNSSTGFISGRGTLTTGAWTTGSYSLVNYGSMGFSGQTTDVYGNVENLGSGTIVSAGGGTVTFYGNVEHNGAAIETSSGSYTVFFGAESGAGNFTGPGTVEFDGNLHPGNSPDIVHYGGDVVMGPNLTTDLLIEGGAPGSGYDQMVVAGNAYLSGTLDVSLGNGYQPQAYQQFDLILGNTIGAFSTLDLPTLGSGLDWTHSQGPNGFVLSVNPTAAPEPSTFVAVGIGAFALLRRRKPAAKKID